MQSHRPTNVKLHNQKFIKQILRERRVATTKNELAKATGLSVVTMNKLIAMLLESGEIIELDELMDTGGRRAAVYQLNFEYELMLVIQYYEKNKVMVGMMSVVNLVGKAIYEQELNNQEIEWGRLSELMEECIKNYSQIAVIIIGIPGVEIDNRLLIMDYAPMLNFELRKAIDEKFHLPVIIENDINAATLGYAFASDKKYVCGLYYPENFPPGASLVINQEIYSGSNGLSGEIKHLSILDEQDFSVRSSEVFLLNLRDVIQTIVSFYDPEEIVIYSKSEIINDDWQMSVEQFLAEKFPYSINLRITHLTELSPNYYNGLVLLGDRYLS